VGGAVGGMVSGATAPAPGGAGSLLAAGCASVLFGSTEADCPATTSVGSAVEPPPILTPAPYSTSWRCLASTHLKVSAARWASSATAESSENVSVPSCAVALGPARTLCIRFRASASAPLGLPVGISGTAVVDMGTLSASGTRAAVVSTASSAISGKGAPVVSTDPSVSSA
jgi:hypothetical protein